MNLEDIIDRELPDQDGYDANKLVGLSLFNERHKEVLAEKYLVKALAFDRDDPDRERMEFALAQVKLLKDNIWHDQFYETAITKWSAIPRHISKTP